MTRRLVTSYLAITFFVLLMLEVPLGLLFANSERRNLVAELKHDALAIGAIAEETLVGNANDDLQKLVRDYQAQTDGRVVITDEEGQLVADSSVATPSARDYSTRPEIGGALAGGEQVGTRRSDTLDTDLTYVAVPVASSGNVAGAVRITYTTTEINARILRMWAALGGIALMILSVVAGVSVLLARSVTRPLHDLEHAASDLAEGDLATRAPTDDGPTEVRTLASSFNAMAAQLEQLVGAQEAFVADASHQLRTPLQALRLRLENAQAVAKSRRASEDLGGALREVRRLDVIVEGLLALARAERERAQPQTVDVALVARERQRVWTPPATERGLGVDLDVPDELEALATPGHLEQVLDNLISNAIDVSPTGERIDLSAARHDGWVEVHVADRGPGMSAEQRRRATDRFWRAPDGKLGGSGLGLAIVHRLVEADGGELDLRDAPDGGLDAVVRLRAPTAHSAAH